MRNTDFIQRGDAGPLPSARLTVTFPPMSEGQTHWEVYQARDIGLPPLERTAYQRAMYRLLMWAHDEVESLWRWLYTQSLRFAPINPPHASVYRHVGACSYRVENVEDEK